MSRIDTSLGDPPRRAASFVPRVPKLNPTVRLEAPGLAIQPPTSETAQQIARINQLVNQAGQVAGTARYLAFIQRREDENQEAALLSQLRREEQAQRSLFEGLGVRTRNEASPRLVNSIRQGEFDSLLDDTQAGATELLGTLYDDDTPRPTREAIDALRPRLEAELLDRRNTVREDAKDQNGLLATSALTNIQTSERGREILGEFRQNHPNATDGDLASYAIRAAMISAESGNESNVTALLDVIPEEYKAERLDIENRLDRTITGRRRDQENAATSAVFDSLTEAEFSGGTFQESRDLVNDYADRGIVDGQFRNQMLRTIDARESDALKTANQSKLDLANRESERGVYGKWFDRAVNITSGGLGLAGLTEGERWVDAAGEEHTVTESEIKERVVGAIVNQFGITAETPFPSTQAAIEASTLLSLNGETVPVWENMLDAGFTGANAIIRLQDETGEIQIPDNLVQAVMVSENLRQINPDHWRRHVSEDARQFYSTVGLALRYTNPGDPKGAIATAVQTRGDRVPGQAPSDKVVMDALPGSMRNAENSTQIVQEVKRLTSLYQQLPGMRQKDAVKEAIEDIKRTHQTVNGTAVYIGNRNLIPSFRESSETVLDEYVAKWGEEDGVRKKDLTLVPGQNDGTWIVYNKAEGLPALRWQSDGLYTDSDLIGINESLAQERAAERAANLRSFGARMRHQRQQSTILTNRMRSLEGQITQARQDIADGINRGQDIVRMQQQLSDVRRQLAELEADQ